MERNPKRVWLTRELTRSERGHFQLEGTCGSERVVVLLDPTIIAKLPESGKEQAILGMLGQIEMAAARMFVLGETQRVHRTNSPEFEYNLIALTDTDLREGGSDSDRSS